MHYTILDDCCAQDDATVHVTIGREITNASCISSAGFNLQFGDDFARPDFWCPANRTRRKACEKGVNSILVVGKLANDVRNDVHHMAVKFDHVAVGDGNAPAFGHATHIITAKIQ